MDDKQNGRKLNHIWEELRGLPETVGHLFDLAIEGMARKQEQLGEEQHKDADRIHERLKDLLVISRATGKIEGKVQVEELYAEVKRALEDTAPEPINFPELQKVSGELTIANIKELAGELAKILPELPEFPTELEIKNWPDVMEIQGKALVKIDGNSPASPIWVALSDGTSKLDPTSLGGKTVVAGQPPANIPEELIDRSGANPVLRTTAGSVVIPAEIEIKNDVGNPIPVAITNFLADYPDLAAGLKLDSIKTKLDTLITNTDSLEVNTDDLEALITTLNGLVATAGNQGTEITLLTSIRDYLDTVETKLQTLIDQTDTLEANTTGLSTAANQATEITRLTEIRDYLDTVETKLASIITALAGTLTIAGTVAVSNFPATQNVAVVSSVEVEVKNDTGNPIPVNGTVELGATSLAALESVTVQNGAGAGAVNIQDGGNSITIDGAVSVSNFPSSTEISNDVGNPIPVNGTVAVNNFPATVDLGATSLAALESITVQNGAGASAVNIQDGGNSITVDGAVTVSGTVDTELTTADLDTGVGTDTRAVVGLVGSKSGGGVLIPGDATAGLKVDLGADNDVTVTGSITANIGTTGGLALAATQTDKSQFTKLTDGTDTALVTAAGELNVLATAQPGVDIGDVTINNASGAGAVNIQDGGNSLTVDGAVTANAGTNLNTSALALESGGNLALAAASLSVMDDWDETDRAKVNTIAGQVGVQAGSGAVTANTQRVVLATDVALPAAATGTLANGAETTVAGTAVSVLAANASRKTALIQNTGLANVRVGVTGVTATTGFQLVPGGHMIFEMPNVPTQAIFAIREGSVSSVVMAQEIT